MRAHAFYKNNADKLAHIQIHHKPSKFDLVANDIGTWRRSYTEIGQYDAIINGKQSIPTSDLTIDALDSILSLPEVIDFTFKTKSLSPETCSIAVDMKALEPVSEDDLVASILVIENRIDYKNLYYNHPWSSAWILENVLWDIHPNNNGTYGVTIEQLKANETVQVAFELSKYKKQVLENIRIIALVEDRTTKEVVAVKEFHQHPYQNYNWSGVSNSLGHSFESLAMDISYTNGTLSIKGVESNFNLSIYAVSGRKISDSLRYTSTNAIPVNLAQGRYIIQISSKSMKTSKVITVK